MSVSDRERSYLRRFAGAIEERDLRESTPDLFRESEAAKHRRLHLIFVIRRKARQLKIDAPPGLENKTEAELESVRLSLSKQIARTKMAAPAQEAAA